MTSTTDILKTALAHEVKASAFYNHASEITENDEARMIFIELTNFEDTHPQRLIDIATAHNLAPDVDLNTYLKDLERDADNTLPAKATELLKSGNMQAVLKFAIKMEEDAEATYRNLAEQMDDDQAKHFCLEIAEEEKSHAKILTQGLDSLSMDEDDRPAL